MKKIITFIFIIGAVFTLKAQIFTKTIHGKITHEGQTGTALLQIDIFSVGQTEKNIRKPLIVAEGLDFGGLLNPENPFGSRNIKGFQDKIRLSGSDLRNQLLGVHQSYDIIYVNWKNGADYMQRNAYALEEVIKWVNSVKVTNEPNVILGQSMGGVIARYALADMEARGETHDTRLFISQDAPQQGANVPLSYQYLYRHLTNQYVTAATTLFGGTILVPLLNTNTNVQDLVSILDTPAARQLLQNWSTSGYGLDSKIHDDFYNELKGLNTNNGYPQQNGIRNIAISNGSEHGGTQNFAQGDLLLSIDASARTGLFNMLLDPIIGIIGGLTLDWDFFAIGLLGILPGNSKYVTDFKLNALYLNQSSRIYRGKIYYEKKIFWFIPVTINITDVNRNQPPGLLSYDNYGGGFFDVSNLIKSSNGDFRIDSFGNLLPSANYGLIVRDRFNFIPTVSALDIGEGNVNLTDSDYKRVYHGASPPTAPKQTPFDNFTTAFTATGDPANNNELHLKFNRRNGDWLAAELTGTDIKINDCSALYSDSGIKIVGRNFICNSSTYELNTNSVNPIWSITRGRNLVNITASGNSVTVAKARNNVTGVVTLRAKIRLSGCNNAARFLGQDISILQKPKITFIDSALTQSLLNGGAVDYNSYIVNSGDRLPFSLNYNPSTTLSWKNTRIDYSESFSDFNGHGIIVFNPPHFAGRNALYLPCLSTRRNNTKSIANNYDLIESYFPSVSNHEVSYTYSPPINFYGSGGLVEIELTASNECGCDTKANSYISLPGSSRQGFRTNFSMSRSPTNAWIDLTIETPEREQVTLQFPDLQTGEITFLNMGTLNGNKTFNYGNITFNYVVTVYNLFTGTTMYTKSFALMDSESTSSVFLSRTSLSSDMVGYRRKDISLNTSHYPNGIYIIRVHSLRENASRSKRLIVHH